MEARCCYQGNDGKLELNGRRVERRNHVGILGMKKQRLLRVGTRLVPTKLTLAWLRALVGSILPGMFVNVFVYVQVVLPG